MSSPATSNFLAAWRKLNASRMALAKIVLSTPSALTLRYATNECHTPDGSTWQFGLSGDPIRTSIGLLDPGLSPVSCSIRLAKRQDASQATGSTLHNLLSSYLWQNAAVTIYLWETSLTDFADALQIFSGQVCRPIEVNPSGMTLYLLQDLSWNKQVPPTLVDKTSYPDSPDVSQGLPIPIIYGDHRALALRAPWTATYTDKSKQEDAGAGRGAVPLVLVDAGVGGASIKAVAAGHDMADLLSRSTGYSAFLVGSDGLSPLDTAGITETLGASESYLSIADETAIAYAAAIPIDVRASENTAQNPRRAMDVFDETSYATLDQSTAKNELQLILPNMGALGRIESVQYSVAWSGNAGNGNNLRIRSRTPGVGFGTTTANWVSTGTIPAVQTGTWAAADYSQAWDFGGGAAVFDVRIDFTGGAANKARIYWVALVVKYRPQRSLVTPSAVSNQRVTLWRPERQIPGVIYDPTAIRYKTVVNAQAQYRLDGQFYSNLKGYKDDGSGTFTGSASSLIERGPDIARHFLVTYGSVSGGNIETGATTTGSFVLARATLRNAQPNDLKLACWIGQRSTVQRIVQQMCEQAGMCIYLDRFTSKWLCFVWKPGATTDYDTVISWFSGDLGSFQCEETSVVDVRHAIRVKYAFDHFKTTTLFEAFLTAASSGQGLNLPTIRDQRLVVTAGVNDKVDWSDGVTTWAATINPATYTPMGLAQDLQPTMRTAMGNNKIHVGHGFSVVAGFNDTLDFIIGATPYTATMTAADYTAESLCIEAARALNAVFGTGRVFACVYDHATNIFTISATGGTFQLRALFGDPTYTTTGWHVLGTPPTTVASSVAMRFPAYADRFYFYEYGLFDFKWGTGANVATNAANLMGFDKADILNVETSRAKYSRGDRERVAETYQGYYGPREERQIAADWIRDEETAVQLRNRIFDLTAKPRVTVRFSSHRVPDIRRMQVIEFSSDIDPFVAYPKYGTDGSWANKHFRVLEVEQSIGPTFQTEVLAVEAD